MTMNLLVSKRGPSLIRIVLLGLATWLVPAVASAGAEEAPTIRIENFSFVPDTVTVPVGTTLTWENGDDIPHSVVLSDKSFRSKPLDTHERASFKVTKVGAVTYFCGLHPHMQGTIVVVP